FSPDGKALYVSGGNQDVVYRYAWDGDSAGVRDSLILMRKARPRAAGKSYPAGLALSPDGSRLYVAENLADSLAVIDVATGTITQRVSTGRYPYGLVVSGDGMVYVSVWGGDVVQVYAPGANGALTEVASIRAGRHPSALLLNKDGTRLYVASASTDRVAVIDTRRHTVLTWLKDPPPAGPGEGSTPNALGLSGDGSMLYVAEADNNAVAVFSLSAQSRGAAGLAGRNWPDALQGRIPTEWYPTGVIATADTLLVLTAKGHGTGPNPDGPQGGRGEANHHAYTLGQTNGSLVTVAVPAGERALVAMSARVAAANGWNKPRIAPHYPPFQHVIYVIKENRTYDQVLGDLGQGDGDSSLTFFPRRVAPNHHALAERFGVFDRFFVNSEVSADGHQWATAAYATDYTEKTTPSNYSSRGRSFDYQGLNRGKVPDDDAAEPANGHIWDLAEKAHVTYRNFGEDVEDSAGHYYTTRRALKGHTNLDAPPFDLNVTDQRRADVFLAEFKTWVEQNAMPQLTILLLSSDHTAGAGAGHRTPRAYVADNDLALGRVVDALTHSPFWASTVMFVLEDDAQNGPDHVDSHRSPFLLISAYSPKGVVHRFANQSDVVATMAEILHLGSLSQYDYYGRPLREVWRGSPDLTPYAMLTPEQSLDEKNPAGTRGSQQSLRLDLSGPDRSDDELFNMI
ncbi:MAG TPA: bifunctional YncE family protein/alkaline phosphatase family protein, partial [Gemmatimonadales bacterium]